MNIYIERLLREIGELTKSKLLIQTQLEYTEKLNAELRQQLDKYQKAEERAAKRGKKTAVDTSDSEVF